MIADAAGGTPVARGAAAATGRAVGPAGADLAIAGVGPAVVAAAGADVREGSHRTAGAA
jgi:hypothetical protein